MQCAPWSKSSSLVPRASCNKCCYTLSTGLRFQFNLWYALRGYCQYKCGMRLLYTLRNIDVATLQLYMWTMLIHCQCWVHWESWTFNVWSRRHMRQPIHGFLPWYGWPNRMSTRVIEECTYDRQIIRWKVTGIAAPCGKVIASNLFHTSTEYTSFCKHVGKHPWTP